MWDWSSITGRNLGGGGGSYTTGEGVANEVLSL